MRKVWAVIRREFVERVRSKWFLISTILGPVFVIAISVLPSLFMRGGKSSHVVIVNAGAGALAGRVRAQLTRTGAFMVELDSVAEDRQAVAVESLTTLVQENALDGILILNAASVEAGSAEYRGRNVSSLEDVAALQSGVRQAIVVERLSRMNVDPAVVQEAQRNIDFKTLRISRRGTTGESGLATFFFGYGVALVLYMVILLYGINVMRSVMEEKQTRIIEILASSMKPFQLMIGKVIGVACVGLFQFSIWALSAYTLLRYRGPILAKIGVSATAIASVQMPKISGELLVVIVVYFLLGYLLYSSMFAVVGASISAESEAQQAQQPVMMLLVFSLMVSFSAMRDASGPLARVTSLIPFSAPIVTPVRMATGDVPLRELALSLAIMVVSVLVVVWISARIYRIGILMYGKRASIKEMVRWARQS